MEHGVQSGRPPEHVEPHCNLLGGAGAKLYINGVEVGSNASTDYPADGFSGYLMMRCGTYTGASCAIDELRVSNIQRTSFNVH